MKHQLLKITSILTTSLALLNPAISHAQQSEDTKDSAKIMYFDEFQKTGFPVLGTINGSLFQNIHKGEKTHINAIFYFGMDRSMSEQVLKILENMNYGGDKGREATSILSTLVDQEAKNIKQAKGYLIPVNPLLGDYDAEAFNIPINISLPQEGVMKTNDTLHCISPYALTTIPNRFKTSCLTINNMKGPKKPFQLLEFKDEIQANRVLFGKNKQERDAIKYYLLTTPIAGYQTMNSDQPLFRDKRGEWIVVGVQPTKAIKLLVVDTATQEILMAVNPK